LLAEGTILTKHRSDFSNPKNSFIHFCFVLSAMGCGSSVVLSTPKFSAIHIDSLKRIFGEDINLKMELESILPKGKQLEYLFFFFNC
jgi:hypothetical protein